MECQFRNLMKSTFQSASVINWIDCHLDVQLQKFQFEKSEFTVCAYNSISQNEKGYFKRLPKEKLYKNINKSDTSTMIRYE